MTIGKEIGRKLSVSELGWDKPAIQSVVIADQTQSHHLARFVGTVTDIKPYKIRDGENAGDTAYGLMGSFEGTSSDGTVLEGSVLYLPGYVNDAIVSIMKADESISSVKIAFDVYAKYETSSATSYMFSVHDLLNTTNEAVEEVKAAIKSLPMPPKPKALAAPKG